MDEHDVLAERFEANRTHLRAVAYRMLGSHTEADDAVQEAWIRLSRSDTDGVENLGGWLTTVVGRVCLDMLRSRKTRREESLETRVVEPVADREDGVDPEQQAVQADSVGLALLVVLETLAPAERLAFVLHDLFAVSFDEIAPIVGKTPAAARQLASRARRRVQGAGPAPETEPARQREVVRAFLAAARGGDFAALLEVLDPDVVVRADSGAVALGSTSVTRGAFDVATYFNGRASAAKVALIDGVFGATWAPGGKPKVVLRFSIVEGRITAIDLVGEPASLGELELTVLDD
ncbi:sigma-70 family RNA polymerase sigma factor [Longispora urticae]